MNRAKEAGLFVLVALACAGSSVWSQGPAPEKPPEQAAPAAAKQAKPQRGKAGIEWVTIPGGSFMMGADDVGPGARPRHQVTIKTFQMTKTLVTFGQYKKCVAAGACRAAHVSDGACNVWNGVDWVLGNLPASFQGDDLPAVCVNWDEAQAFAEWAGGRLPTEAEWEYAARSGGRDQKYPWGDEAPSCDLTVFSSDGTACGKNSTWPVCSKPKGNTKQGLCDMDSGDVWELVQDWYHDSYNGAPTDGSAWLSPPGPFRVLRGGSRLISLADYLRATYRSQGIPGSRFDLNGFRLARSSR